MSKIDPNKLLISSDFYSVQGKELEAKMENFWNDIFNDPDVPQDIKDRIIEDREKLKKNAEEYEKYLEENKHRKIIGYNSETFEPIYE